MDKKKPNDGHRERLRQKYICNGIDVLEEHEILELMLFFVIPRGNTNHTAHHLIDAFGGIDGVFDADIDTLTEVEGVGRSSAEFIKFQREMFSVYARDRECAGASKFTQSNGIEFIKGLFSRRPDVPQFYMILLGSENRIISVETIAEENIDYAVISIRDIVSKAIKLNAFRVIFAHNHVNGNVMPSDGDIMFTKRINKVLDFADIELNDHIVVTGNTAVSMRNDINAFDNLR